MSSTFKIESYFSKHFLKVFMFKGISFVLIACLIWGLIFVVPEFMKGFSSLEIALGRYLFYSLISAFFFLKSYRKGLCRYSQAIWLSSLKFSLMTTLGYYTFVVLCLRYSTPAICALILGLGPLTIAFYGNWLRKEYSYRSLALPSLLILAGLLIINVPKILESPTPTTHLLGLLCGFWALISWTWYVVHNSLFLKANPQLLSRDWVSLIGVSSIFWVILFIVGLRLFFPEQLPVDKYVDFNQNLLHYLLGCATLGIVCSWLASVFWNKACLHLPVAFAGQLTIFETIFGLLFVYTLENHFPPAYECFGIGLLLGAIFICIRQQTSHTLAE